MDPINNKLQLSIVVPIYNVEEYLLACLDSLDAATCNIEAEILLIDDGSTDSSSNIAKDYVKTHPAFKYYRKENGGLSDARNFGAARVTGKYMSFVDSDDLVTEDMFETMIASAELNDTDFTITNVTRFNSTKVYESELYRYVYSNLQDTVTHISQCDNLIYDTTTCNKLIRRSFWVENGFKYPVGWRFEDMSVSFAMHCRARRISIVRTAGYLWRARDGETKSITQENSSVTNLKHRLAMIGRIFQYIDTEMHGDERLKRLLSEKVLSLDLIIYINEIGVLPEKAQEEFREVIMEFFESHYTMDDLEKLSVLKRQKYIDLMEKRYEELEPLRVYGKSAYYSAPVIQGKSGRKLLMESDLFDERHYDIKNDFATIEPLVSITDVGYSNGNMWIDLYSLFRRISIGMGEQQIYAALLNVVTGEEHELQVKSIIEREATARFGRIYDLAGKKDYDYNYEGAAFRVTIDPEELNESSYGSNVLLIRYSNPVKEGVCYVKTGEEDDLSRFEGGSVETDKLTCAITFDAAGCLVIRVGSIEDAEGEAETKSTETGIQADVIRLSQGEETSIKAEVSIDDMGWTGSGNVEIKYKDKLSGKSIVLSSGPVEMNGERTTAAFTIDFSDKTILTNLYDMRSQIVIGVAEEGRDIPVFADKEMHVKLYSDSLAITLMGDTAGRLMLDIHKTDALTINQKAYYRRIRYREFRKEPINDKIIVFESYWGTQYSCNPRALYEYIDLNYPEYICVWSLKDERMPINGRGIRVRKSSEEYYRYLATAKYFVNNVNFELSYVKRHGQIEIQTMHGTPFKTVGLDVTEEFRSEQVRQNYLKKNSRWNYLIAQGRFTKDSAFRWYGFEKTMLLTGYPRTDELFNITELEKGQIKKKLGLPDNKKVILYAPTFRDQGTYETPLDLEHLRNKLSDKYILLTRLHHFVSASYKIPEDRKFIFDVSGYNSIEELYKITDVLVTDYSSVMFDFALTDKPMIFYAYDLEDYKNKIRGVYFDICEEAPGPVVRTTEKLAERIIEGNDAYQERIKEFKEKYLTYECSNSCEKVFNKAIKKNRETAVKLGVKKVAKTVFPKRVYKKKDNNKAKGMSDDRRMNTIKTIINEHIQYKDQVLMLAKSDLIKTYRGAALGWGWAIIKPLITLLVFWFAFSVGLRHGKPIAGYPYFLWLEAGFLPWFYMSEMITGGAGCIRKYRHLVTKMKFPISTIPTFFSISHLYTHFILLAFSIVLFMCFGYMPDIYMLQIPLYMLMMLAFFTIWSLMAGMLSAISRDFENLVKAFSSAIFWMSGIIYNVEDIETPWIRVMLKFNPVTVISSGYRRAFIYKKWFWQDKVSLVCFAITFTVFLILAVRSYKKLRKEVPDVL